MSGAIRVMIVDDHDVVREGLRHVLNPASGFEVVAESASATDAVARAARVSPDVILLDITMPGGSGLDAVPRLREAAPSSRILMLSVHDDSGYVLASVRAGAHGYLRKDSAPAELREAVRHVHAGNAFFSPPVARQLAAAIRDGAEAAPPARAVEQLTAREREVLAGIARGLANKEIASELGISTRTVEAHRDSIAKKLGIRSAAALTRLALDAGLVGGR